ncbi:MAG: DUF433 domain-containing protein [Planctomycetota bacterium]
MVKIEAAGFPNYTAQDAARYTRLPYSTVLYWARGRDGRPPVIRAKDGLSFLNLVEIHMLGVFRRFHGVTLQKLRKVVVGLAKRYPNERHPLATRKFWTDGKSVFTEEIGKLVSLDQPGQLALPRVVECYAARVQWDGSAPRRLFPFTTRPEMERLEPEPRSVVIDPRVAFGRPVVAGTRITTRALYERFEAGESMAALATDYDIEQRQVEDAIRCEQANSAA